ncbi:hypothetical protein ABZZ20_30535 [Streptomyces sp. NPDC006430]|uniref:hypothetical protein n=1 Tax=Streptomyces sp. NPDC006430 TaxID=3154299 RepID=UPI0033AC17B2
MNHRIRAATALIVLTWPLTACGGSDGAGPFERCVPEESATVSTAELDGSYEGSREAAGARLTLTSRPGQVGGTLTAENWPTGDAFRDELGPSFSTTGTWELTRPSGSTKHPLLRLHFDPPKPDLPTPDTIDLLSVGIDAKRTFIYDNADPDTCPDFRLQLRKK